MQQYNRKRDIINIILFALIAFYCTLPLFIHHGLPYIDDMVFHSFQANQFDRAIRDGVIYPRWIPDANNGYGSANFIFYAPLSYYLVSAIRLFTPSLTTAMIAAIWLGFFLSGVTMFVATNKMFGGTGNPLPAIIYQILPFHLGDLYIRGTFAELVAFIWFPLVILFAYKILESRNKMAFIGLSISYAGLILTHLVSGFIFTLVIGAYLIYNYFLKNKKPLLKTLLSLILGLGLSSFYLIPAIFEKKFVQIDYIIKCPVGDYRKNFLFMWNKVQIILEHFYLSLHITVILEVILFLFIILVIQRNREKLLNRLHVNFFMLLFLSAFILTTPLSKPLWDIVPGFPFLQFPWRWVMVMELSLCLLIGAAFSLREMPGFRLTDLKKRWIVYLMVALSLVSLNTILQGSHHISKIAVSTVDVREYTPIWAGDMRKIMSEAKIEMVSVVSGEALTDIVEWTSEERVISTKASTPALLRISTFYYPGWEAGIDGNRANIMIEKESGAMLIDIPQGEHKLVLKFEDTPVRHYAKIISILSFCIAVLLVFFSKKTNRDSKTEL